MKLYIHFSVVAHFVIFLFRLSLHEKQEEQPINKEQLCFQIRSVYTCYFQIDL